MKILGRILKINFNSLFKINYYNKKNYSKMVNLRTFSSELKKSLNEKNFEMVDKIIQYMDKKGLTPSEEPSLLLVDEYIKIKDMKKARFYFTRLERSGVLETSVTLEKMIKGYLNSGEENEIEHFVNRLVIQKIDCSPTIKGLILKMKDENLKNEILNKYR
jgi:hypothetical protein